MSIESLLKLIEDARFDAVETQWLKAIDQPDADVDQLVGALEALVAARQVDQAELLAWTWLTAYRSRCEPRQASDLALRLLALLPESDQLRDDVGQLYPQAWPDRGQAVVAASGLEGGQPTDRVLRVLDACRSIEPGGFVVERTERRPYRVEAFDADAGAYTLAGSGGRVEVPIRDLAYHYEPAGPDDFRVLEQLTPERIAVLAENDPAALVLGVVRSRGGQMSADDLRYVLSPQHVESGRWSKWWTSARAALRRGGRVRIEGRSPVMLVYDPAGVDPTKELARELAGESDPMKQWPLVRSYLRSKPSDLGPVLSVGTNLQKTFDHFAEGDPSRALQAGAVLEWLGGQPALAEVEVPTPRWGELLRASDELTAAMVTLGDAQLWEGLLGAIRRDWSDSWMELYVAALAVAPPGAADRIAAALLEAGQAEQVQAAIDRALQKPGRHFATLIWLWQGPATKLALGAPGRVEVLLRLLAALDEWGHPEPQWRAVSGTARSRLRSAVLAKKRGVLRECVGRIEEPSMASALRRQIERCRGLSSAARQDALATVREVFPQIWAEPKVEPWADPNALYVTREGQARKQAELDEIVDVKMRENARALGEAAAHGDLSENSEYRFALEERDLLRARMAQIQNEMVMARILTGNDVSNDRVNIGTRVTLTGLRDGRQIEVTILSPWEADAERRIYNYKAPVCQQLLGLKPGDAATLSFDGEPQEYRVEQIDVAIT
jgi:transcription elongation GreA/GreB family factor